MKAGDLFCEHPGGRVEMESASPVPCRKTRTTSTLPSGFCGCVNLQLAQRHCMLLLLNDQRKLKKPEGLSPTGFYLSVFRRLLLEQQRHVDLLTDPAHHRHGHRVAQGFISRPVGALICRLVAPRYLCVVVREALKSFTFCGRQAADGSCGQYVRLITAAAARTQATGNFITKLGSTATLAAP